MEKNDETSIKKLAAHRSNNAKCKKEKYSPHRKRNIYIADRLCI